MTEKTKGFLFDLDGTLIDSLADLAGAVNTVLDNRGFAGHAVENYRFFVGDGLDMMLLRAFPHPIEGEELAAARREFDDAYARHCLDNTCPYPGVVPLLQTLRGRGIRIGVVSNKPHAFVISLCKALFPVGLLDSVLGQQGSIPRKPSPEGALLAAREMHLHPSQIIYVGDSGVDMLTAKSAGMMPVGVLWGFRTKEELIQNGAEALVSRPEELLDQIR